MSNISIQLEGSDGYQAAEDFYRSVGYLAPIVNTDIVFTARDQDKIIGVVRLSVEESTLVLRGMMIAPSHQRQGIGSLMLSQLEKAIGPRDCYCLPHGWLDEFYGQIGFVTIADSMAPPHLKIRLSDNRRKYPKLILMRRLGAT